MHERVTRRGCLLWRDGSAATAAAAVWRLLCNTTAKAEASAGTLWKKRRERCASSSCIRPAAPTLGPLPAMMVEVIEWLQRMDRTAVLLLLQRAACGERRALLVLADRRCDLELSGSTRGGDEGFRSRRADNIGRKGKGEGRCEWWRQCCCGFLGDARSADCAHLIRVHSNNVMDGSCLLLLRLRNRRLAPAVCRLLLLLFSVELILCRTIRRARLLEQYLEGSILQQASTRIVIIPGHGGRYVKRRIARQRAK